MAVRLVTLKVRPTVGCKGAARYGGDLVYIFISSRESVRIMLTNKQFIKLLSSIEIDDTWNISYIDFDMDDHEGWINFIKNEKFVKHDDGVVYYEFDLLCVSFSIEHGTILKQEMSHECDYAAIQDI